MMGHGLSIRLAAMLGHSLWIAAVIAALAAISCHFTVKSSHGRYTMWLTSLLMVAFSMPAVFVMTGKDTALSFESSSSPSSTITDLPRLVPGKMDESAAESDPPIAVSSQVMHPEFETVTTLSRPESVNLAIDVPWQQWLVLVWMFGVAIMCGRLCLSLQDGRKLRQRAESVHDDFILSIFQSAARRLQFRLAPTIAWSAEIVVPAVVGVLRPVILLPFQVATGLSAAQLESLLIHELVHLKRRDPWVNFLQLVMETVCFFNPAVWIISRNLRRQREFCCDDTVLQLGHISAVDYADALVAVAEASLASRTVPVTLIGAVEQRVSELSLRIDRILGTPAPGRSIFPGQAFAAFAVVVLLIGGILTAALQTPQPPEDASSQAAPASIASTDQSRPKSESERDRLLRLTKDSDAYVRSTAMRALHIYADENLVLPMIDLLRDSDSTVRAGAASLLSDASDKRAVEPLIKALGNARDHFEITQIIDALAETKDSRIVEPLINALVNAQNQWEATAIISALGATKDPRAIEPIVAAFKQYPDLDGNSIRAVANFDDDRIRDALFARVSEAEVPSFSLVNILVTMNDRRLIPRMLQLLEAPNRNRRNAIQVLGQLKAVEAVPELQRLVVGKEKEDRESASYALGRIGDPTSIPNLMLALKNEPDDEALEANCWALGEFGEVQALPRLEELQTHKSPRVTRAAKNAIAVIHLGANLRRREAGDEAALATAIDGLKSSDESIVISAIEYVRHHHEDRRTEILGHLCADQRNDVRRAAITGLLTDESSAAVEAMASALSVSNSEHAVIQVLAKRRDDRALPVLLKMIHGDNVGDQRFAAENLHYFGNDTLPILRDLLASDDEKLRRAALTSLQEIADVSVLDALLNYVVEETWSTEKSRIIDTLGRIDDPRSIQYLETLLDDPRQTHAHDAVRALVRLGWKPRTEEQRIRYLVVSGQRDSNSIPRTQGTQQKQTGDFVLNVPIQTALKGGTGEHPAIYSVGSIEFRNDGNNVKAIAKGYGVSWPKLTFRMVVRLLGKDNLLIAEQSANVATSGIIITVALQQADDIELDLGGINPADVRRFEVSFSTIIDPLPPGVSVSSHVDRDFVLNENIPLKLSASRGESQQILSCDAVKLNEGEPNARKRHVINAELPLSKFGGINADWRVWGVAFAENDEAIGHGTTDLTTTLEHQDIPQQENVTVPITIWRSDSKPAKYIRVGLALNSVQTGVDGNRVTESVDHSLPKSATAIQIDDGTAESKRSIAASGHAVRFQKPPEQKYLEGVQIFGARYGTPEPPKADFHVYVLDEQQQTVADLTFPYSAVSRGDMQWQTLRTPSVELTDVFYIAIAFNPHQTKGVYLGLDDSPEATSSLTGLPGEGFTELEESQNWMVRPFVAAKPTGNLGTRLLKDRPVASQADPFTGCIEAVSFVGNPEDKQSYGGAGPAIDIDIASILPDDVALDVVKLKGIRIYASRYGSGYDTKTTTLDLLVPDQNAMSQWMQSFPYEHFGYKVKWVDLVIPEPPLIAKYVIDGKLTLGLDPHAQQRQGIYFHYEKLAEAAVGMRGIVPGERFFNVDNRRWAVQVFLTK